VAGDPAVVRATRRVRGYWPLAKAQNGA
jgi:hypothetical protein